MNRCEKYGKWSWKFSKCRHCDTIKIKHRGRGLCFTCWWIEYNKTEKRKQTSARINKRRYAKIKNDPEYRKKKYKHYKDYQLRNTTYKKYLSKVYLRQGFERFLKKRKNLKKWENGLEILIDGTRAKTPIKKPRVGSEKDFERIVSEIKIFKIVYKKHVTQ